MAEPVVLVVEDDPNDATLLALAFRKLNMTIRLEFASGGDRALDYLRGHGDYEDRVRFPLPALVLMDIKLPGMSGLEVLDAIRSEPTIRRIPIVMLTSSAQTEDINEAYDAGARSYLVQPSDPRALQELVQAIASYWLRFNQPVAVTDD